MNEYEFEPVPGLPEDLPAGERILWQGAPRWQTLAQRLFHLKVLGVYFMVLLVLKVATELMTGTSIAEASASALFFLLLGLGAVGVFVFYAYLIARSTIYTITNKRLVMRFGIALPMTVNVPFSRIHSGALKYFPDGSGDIPVALDDSQRVSYVVMWPHVRPWHFRHPQPMLRSVPDAVSVADIIADSATNAVPDIQLTRSSSPSSFDIANQTTSAVVMGR